MLLTTVESIGHLADVRIDVDGDEIEFGPDDLVRRTPGGTVNFCLLNSVFVDITIVW